MRLGLEFKLHIDLRHRDLRIYNREIHETNTKIIDYTFGKKYERRRSRRRRIMRARRVPEVLNPALRAASLPRDAVSLALDVT